MGEDRGVRVGGEGGYEFGERAPLPWWWDCGGWRWHRRGVGREEAVAAAWAEELARRIGVDGVETMRGEDVLELLAGEARGDDEGGRVLEEAYLEGIRGELGS